MRFADKRVLVTGSGRRTGLGIAQAFAREGARVAVTDLQAADVAAAAAQVPGAVGLAADLSTPGGVAQLFGFVEDQLGGLDVLVNNAVNQGIGPTLAEVTDDLLVAVMAVNVLGTYRCTQAAARLMIRQGGAGAIVNLGSNTADRPVRGRSAYAASKGAIASLTRASALDLAPHGIRVNEVAPGYILTERWDQIADERASRRRANIPLGEPVTYEQVAAAVLYLASAEAAGVTGARIVVDGGVLSQMVPADADG